jgi:lipopolysaccharide biosynthesis regulator YciM
VSTGKPPKGGKPFLADDDLLAELDAWDATFDALHTEEPAREEPKAPPAMEWPTPPAPDPTVITQLPPATDASATLAYDDSELDAQMTLDAALDEPNEPTMDRTYAGAPAATFADTFDGEPAEIDGDETDFSVVGVSGKPAALGTMLGRSETLPPIDDEDDPETRIDLPASERATTRPPEPTEIEEEEVFTSASRPNRAPPPEENDFEDTLAPPPTPEVRRTPAIVRRTQASIPAINLPREEKLTPARGVDVSAFAEETRIQDVGEMESRRQASKTLPPPIEEDEYELEIGGVDDEAAPVIAVEVDPVSRPTRTAHVVRRTEAPTRPPPSMPAPTAQSSFDDDDEVSMSLDAGDPDDFAPPPIEPADEDDFSDVAAAVGATDDVLDSPRQGITPRPQQASGITPVPPHDIGPRGAELDDALSGLDLDDNERDPTPLPIPQVDDFDLDPSSTLAGTGAPKRPSRPPALVDLYPRVKTPTSVPPLGSAPDAPRAPSALPVFDDGGNDAQTVVAARAIRLQTSIPVEVEAPDPEPEIDLDAPVRGWAEQVPPLASTALDEAAAQSLLVYERELSTLDDSASTANLRIEAGRLCERLTDADRARAHYDAALLADPRATAALRGLRRLARASGDLVEAVRHLDAEIAVAGALERRPLGHYRIDLLMASNDQDLARVAVGEILDSAPSDVRALLAHLELAFLDGRADEFGSALEQLAHAVTDSELRAAVQSARGALAAHHNDTAAAATYFSAAAESDPSSLSARIGAVRHAAAQADGEKAGRALLDLARQVEAVDPITAAAAAIRAQQWIAGEVALAAASVATTAAPTDPLVARLAAETSLGADEAPVAASAFAHWSTTNAAPAERAYAAARAAELDPARGAELWSAALELDPGDDYAAAQLRTAHVAIDATGEAIAVDLVVASDPERERARLRAAYGLIAQGQLDAAIEILEQGRAARPGSLALAEALGEALAAASRWTDRAKLYAQLAADPGEQLDREVAQLRSALAWEEAVGAASVVEAPPDAPNVELQTSTVSALEAWGRVLEGGNAPEAHAAAIVLASRLGDRDVMSEVLARAQSAERSPWAAASLGLRRARLHAEDAGRSESILREVAVGLDDPRKTVAITINAARQKDLADAGQALEERANALESKAHANEIAALRLRAAQIALDANDAPRATGLLARVEAALPQLGVIPDLLAAARRRAGDRPTSGPIRRPTTDTMPKVPTSGPASADAFARVVRDADLAAAQGDGAAALALYQNALDLRPGDPLATVPLIRAATQLRDPGPISSLALAQLRAAEEAQDGAAKAHAYELLAHIDQELNSDPESAQVALESAQQADPSRIDLMHRLERRFTVEDKLGSLMSLRENEVALIPVEHTKDRAALLADLASLATRDKRPEIELADLHRKVLEVDPGRRLALMYLEAIVRRSGFSDELAQLEERIAIYFEGEPKTQAAFWTRAGETLAEMGKIDEAVQRFGKADAALPGHVPALEGWRQAALKGQLWLDVAEAAQRQAANAPDDKTKAKLFHFAGVSLMDKALEGERAMAAFKKALDADPRHRDAFLRQRILLEEDANHDELAVLLAQRLEVEEAGPQRMELHRALAELCRNFLSDRERAKEHYRAILEGDPNDLRAHAAIADIAWEQGNWQEAADALMSRARLERQPDVLKTLCFRLGLIYADRLVDVPMALKAFQRALTYQPDDENVLVRLADLATQAGEWKLALGACERLVKNEQDPDRRAIHLHRVAKIFKDGFNDNKRAERALNLALDGAPTNDDALTQLVQFYKSNNDMVSVRVHLNRVAGQMRARSYQNPRDGVAYRVISRAMAARANAGVDGSLPIARAAAELADLLGESGEPEQRILRTPPKPDLAPLLRPEADDVLFPRGVQLELRQIFQLLGDRIAKHVGVNLGTFGVTRGDRLRAKDNAMAAVAQSVATGLGFGEIDVYISQRQPYAMAAEPTSPVSLVLGSAIAQAGGDAIRFAAGAALKLAQASVAIPARLTPDELGVLVVALLRVLAPDFPIPHGVDPDAVAAQNQKLKRLIPNNLMTELRPFALAVDTARFDHKVLARDLRVAGLRAGLVSSGSLVAGLRVLVGATGGDLPSFLADPVAQGLIVFALSEDHAVVAR